MILKLTLYLQARKNLLTSKAFEKPEKIQVLLLSPLPGYCRNEASKNRLWVYKGDNTLLPSVKQARAGDLLPNIIRKNEEVEVRDAKDACLNPFRNILAEFRQITH